MTGPNLEILQKARAALDKLATIDPDELPEAHRAALHEFDLANKDLVEVMGRKVTAATKVAQAQTKLAAAVQAIEAVDQPAQSRQALDDYLVSASALSGALSYRIAPIDADSSAA